MPGKPAAPHVNKAGQLERDIYDAKQTQELPGTQVRYEGQPSNGDVAVDEAYDYLGITHDFFWKEYQRDSLDNKGLIPHRHRALWPGISERLLERPADGLWRR